MRGGRGRRGGGRREKRGREEGGEEEREGGKKRKFLRARSARRSRREEGDEGAGGGGKGREGERPTPLSTPSCLIPFVRLFIPYQRHCSVSQDIDLVVRPRPSK